MAVTSSATQPASVAEASASTVASTSAPRAACLSAVASCEPSESPHKPSQRQLPVKPVFRPAACLRVVRDLLDGYAADPLGAPRPGSSGLFFERYVERQAEIEHLLEQQQQPPPLSLDRRPHSKKSRKNLK